MAYLFETEHVGVRPFRPEDARTTSASSSRNPASPVSAKIAGMAFPARLTISSSVSTKTFPVFCARIRPTVVLPAPGMPMSTIFMPLP